MSNDLLFDYHCVSEAETVSLAGQLANVFQPGDLIALTGDLGAGKSTLARAFIRARLEDEHAEVPSPTFTLVQNYEDDQGEEIFHADLYRLTDPEEAYELGLDEAREQAICLIEWPDRMPAEWWENALELVLTIGEAGERRISFRGKADLWSARLKELAA